MVDLRAFLGASDLYFIRHGESEGNRDAIIQGRNPSQLTVNGRRQALAAGEWFRDKSLDHVLTSPLLRASETARIIAGTAGVGTVEEAEELSEIDTGIFSGLSFIQAGMLHPVEWRSFQVESWEGVPGAERIEDLLARAERAWARLREYVAQGKRRLLCVTHSGFLQWIIRSTLGGTSWMPLFASSENCAVSHLNIMNATNDGADPGHLARWMMINASVHVR